MPTHLAVPFVPRDDHLPTPSRVGRRLPLAGEDAGTGGVDDACAEGEEPRSFGRRDPVGAYDHRSAGYVHGLRQLAHAEGLELGQRLRVVDQGPEREYSLFPASRAAARAMSTARFTPMQRPITEARLTIIPGPRRFVVETRPGAAACRGPTPRVGGPGGNRSLH